MITDGDWSALLASIFEYNQCTPFLGAGACTPFFPSGQELAEKWAAEMAYPFHQKDLSEVAQFIAVNSGAKVAKIKMDQVLKGCLQAKPPPDFKCPASVHGVLADLPLKNLPDDQLRLPHGIGADDPATKSSQRSLPLEHVSGEITSTYR
jgi:hypothetical protein